MKFNAFSRSFAGSSLSVVAAVLAALPTAAPALAQEAAASAQALAEPAGDDPASEEGPGEEIVVTGTNIRGVAPIGASSAVVTRKDIEQSGQSRISDLLRQLPQVQTTSNFSDVPLQDGPATNALTGGGSTFSNPTRGSATDLRGLGPQATLVLVDGRRQLATGTTSSFVETNRLPLAALERIEIVTDGASAIYGSDAVAGVINFITRKDYRGAELTGRYSRNSSYDEFGLSATAGTRWELGGRDGGIIASYDYDHRSQMTYADNRFTRSDQTWRGGNNALLDTSTRNPAPAGAGYYYFSACPSPTAIIANGLCLQPPTYASLGAPVINYADIPAGVTGAPVASVASTALPANIQSGDQFRNFLPENNRHSLNVYAHQTLNDWLSAYYQFTGSLRNTNNIIYSTAAITVTRASPFFPTGANIPATVNAVTVPLPGYITRQTARDRQFANTLGLRADLPHRWQGEIYASWAKASQNPGSGESIEAQQLNQAALDRLVLRGEYNPFAGAPSQDIANRVRFGKSAGFGDLSRSSAWDFVAKFNGPLLDIGGGTVRAALGGEHTRYDNRYEQANIQATCPAFVSTGPGSGISAQPCTLARAVDPIRSGTARRTVSAAFAELYVPLIGPGNAVPLIRRLDLDLALRAEHYSDFGNTVNPRVGVKWEVTGSLGLRGSWGKAFRAPNLTEISASSLPIFSTGSPNLTGNPAYGPVSGAAAVTVGGANPDLGPERAVNWSVGFDFKGQDALRGLSLSGTYYNIHYKDKIVALPLGQFLSSPANGLIYARYLTPVANPAPAGCDPNNPATYAPEVRAVLQTVPTFSVGNICSASLVIDARWQNAASVFQDGLDLNLGYRWDWGRAGTFNLGVNLTKILHIKEQLVAGVATTPDPIDRVFNPLSFRARGNFGWNSGPFAANLTVNYTPGYTNDVGFIAINPPPAANSAATGTTRIKSWTTADLSLSYDLRGTGGGWLDGWRIGLNVNNLLDTDPPLALIGRATVSYDARVANPYGRTVAVQVTKAIGGGR